MGIDPNLWPRIEAYFRAVLERYAESGWPRENAVQELVETVDALARGDDLILIHIDKIADGQWPEDS